MVPSFCFGQPVIVNGVTGEDTDGVSPFETLQAAVNYSLVNSATEIEIQTNGPMAGAQIILATMPVPLAIRAGAGYEPVITANLSLIPSNPEQEVTLEGLRVQLAAGIDCAMWIGCNLTANDCTFRNTPGGGGYNPAVTACTGGPGTTATLIMNNCTLSGHTGLAAGRSVRDYVLRDCYIEGRVSDLPSFYSHAIGNHMNWAVDFSVRLDGNLGYTTISEPRTLTLERCVVNGGTIIGWPAGTLPTLPYVANETNTIGPIIATNCVFIGGDAMKVGHPGLPSPNAVSSVFKHCTWRASNYPSQWGLASLPACPNDGHQFWNCLFDMPNAVYGIGTGGTSVVVTGDANVYNMPPDVEFVDYSPAYPDWPSRTPFEATKYTYTGIPAGGPYITWDDGGHVSHSASAVLAEAVPLSPPVTDDVDGDSRPLPAEAAASDIGADEFDEASTSATRNWEVYR